MSQRKNPLKLENQLCFPLYACSKEVIRRYKKWLNPLGLTYTQYIAMMVLWEEKSVTAAHLGERLWLDSGTLTPMLKKMEQQGLLTRERSSQDERNLMVTITEKGIALEKEAAKVPNAMAKCMPLEPEEAMQLYNLLYKILKQDPAQ